MNNVVVLQVEINFPTLVNTDEVIQKIRQALVDEFEPEDDDDINIVVIKV